MTIRTAALSHGTSINPLKLMKTMKKYIFMAVAGMLALSSCSNDDNDVQNTQNAPRQMTFTAGFGDEAQTRATLNGKKVSFETGDDISILSANNTNTRFATTEDGALVTFTGTATADSKFYAVYPYTDDLTLDTSTGIISGVEIPVGQYGAVYLGWDPRAPIAYATTTGTSLQFHNACALLKITNDRGEGEAMIEVSCHEALTGRFSLDTSSGALSGSDDTYRFAYVGGVPIDKTIYIAIAPGEKTDFTAVWDGGSDHVEKMKHSAVTFEAGKIYDLGNTSAW